MIERPKAMLFDRIDLFLAEAAALFAEAQDSEAPVALVTSGAPGDLGHFGDAEAAIAVAVELLEPGEGDLGNVHVEAHADRICCDQIIDLAALEHRDLCIAGGWRKRTHDDCGP